MGLDLGATLGAARELAVEEIGDIGYLRAAIMNEKLMAVAEEFAAFLTLSKPDELKPEVAEWGMTRLRDLLSELNAEERVAFVAYLERSAEDSDGDYAIFVAELPERLGLRGEGHGASAS